MSLGQIEVVGIAGSARPGSWNQALLGAAIRHAPDGMVVAPHRIEALPFFDADGLDDPPAPVAELRDAIDRADGVLWVTPEHNYGVPAVLKNALDWMSRPAYASVLRDKPVAVLGAAPGPVGTARAQGQLKQNLLGVAAAVLPWPEPLFAKAHERFDPQGQVVDDRSITLLEAMLVGFGEWIGALGSYGANASRPD